MSASFPSGASRPGIPAPVAPPAPVALTTLPSLPTVVAGATDMASKYEILEQIGSGTYGYVFRARVRGTDKVVALKRIKMDDPRPEAQRDGVRVCMERNA
jgi:serine/threonine protein kinase